MKQAALWCDSETYILTHLEFFNWGGFQGLHRATIDSAGTAVIGPTGSGKTTLVDGLMTLLCANPRYNLASTGGHESDRDLVSYVRGVSGPGDGGQGQSHIARQGKTVTAIVATLARDTKQVRLGALLWFEGSSSAAADLSKLWLFSDAPEQTLEYWLSLHHEGGMRALRKMEKESTGIWTYPSKKAYLARLRDHFDVGENAFTLLNRAAGLKQLNSIDEIFRELVLDDRSAFVRAAEVVSSFDDLTAIHHELEIARKQQRSLQPLAEGWERHQAQQQQLLEKQILGEILPIWFAEQAHRLWSAEENRLKHECKISEESKADLQNRLNEGKRRVEEYRQRYLNAGGAAIDQLRERISDWETLCRKRGAQADQYQHLARNLGFSDTLTPNALRENQDAIDSRLFALDKQVDAAKEHAFDLGVAEHEVKIRLERSLQELQEVRERPGSNLPGHYQAFRSALAAELSLEESALPFVAELVQVKAEERLWRGAIERAIGGNRLRIFVSPEFASAAFRWVDQRHNALHVRLLEVESPTSRPVFFEDGFTRKLVYKDHPYREAVKALLANNDRHCVDNPELLRHKPHSLTVQGSMSGRPHFFDKKDQKRLEDDWCTGFDNRDRLDFLAEQIGGLEEQQKSSANSLRVAQDAVDQLMDQVRALGYLKNVCFDDIDLLGAQQQLTELREHLNFLTKPDSDIAIVKLSLQEAEDFVEITENEYQGVLQECAVLQKDLDRGVELTRKAYQRAEQGLTDIQRSLGTMYFPALAADQLNDIQDVERTCIQALSSEIDALKSKINSLALALIKGMSDAKKEDAGALSEVGRELEDIPHYLERLRILTEEALPEKLKRFLEYLNRSSDDGVTQLLSYIDSEVSVIEERLEDLNSTMRRVDFQPGRYLQLNPQKVIHESVRTLQRAQRQLNSARFADDAGESQYEALREVVGLLKDACDRNRTQGAKSLLDPRFRLEFSVTVIERETGAIIETRKGSQGGSGGEKEIIASYVLTASLSYALCPDGSSRPLFGTIILDEAFSRSSHAVAGRIIAALREFGLHAVFITPNKEMRLLRHHTRSAIVVHRRGLDSSLTSLSWETLDEHYQRRRQLLI